MRNEIMHIIDACSACQKLRPTQQAEPMTEEDVGKAPMEQVAMDLFDLEGETWLIMVDRFSGHPWATKLCKTNTQAITDTAQAWFLEVGYPKPSGATTDHQFRGPFTEFCDAHGINHQTSSPYNPSSNGLAEAAVKNMKYLLKKCKDNKEDFRAALLKWRNTPNGTRLSLSKAFCGRRQRGQLPGIKPINQERASFHDIRQAQKDARKAQFDEGTKALPLMQNGQEVWVQNPSSGEWSEKGTIKGICNAGRLYDILMNDGPITWCNRRLLRPIPDAGPESSSKEEYATTAQEQAVEQAPTPRHSARLAEQSTTESSNPRHSSRVA